MQKILISLFLGFSFVLLSAQDNFPTQELEAFAKIHLNQKRISPEDQSAIFPLLQQYEISRDRYVEILKTSLIAERQDLSPKEQDFILAVKKEQTVWEQRKIESIKSACQNEGLDYSQYEEILRRYKSDIQFQRALKPYFDSIIKGD